MVDAFNECNYIIVLAGGLNEDGEPHDFVKSRLDEVINIYHNGIINNKKNKIICLGGGTYHKPPNLNKLNYVIHESSSCAVYLIENGVNENDVMREWSSYDTIANGFYFLTNFVLPLKIKKCKIVTSNFHMERSKIIFDFFIKFAEHDVDISYLSISDDVMNKDILDNRIKREKQSSINFMALIKDKNNLTKFTEWFYTEHNAYKAIITYYPMDNKLKNTY